MAEVQRAGIDAFRHLRFLAMRAGYEDVAGTLQVEGTTGLRSSLCCGNAGAWTFRASPRPFLRHRTFAVYRQLSALEGTLVVLNYPALQLPH